MTLESSSIIFPAHHDRCGSLLWGPSGRLCYAQCNKRMALSVNPLQVETENCRFQMVWEQSLVMDESFQERVSLEDTITRVTLMI